MALPKFSFHVISQEEFDARRKEEAVAATTAALSAKPPRRFSVAFGVPGVVPKIKKKSDSLFSTNLDFAACKPPRKLSAPVVVVPKLKKKSSRPPFRSSKVIPVNSYMEVIGAIPLAPDLVVIISSASSLML
jgi:hypothetical protein